MVQSEVQVETKFGQTIGDTATVLGLVNGMIGGTILVLPLIGIKTGYITTIIVSLVVGYISYYTAKLYVIHLGKEKDIREAVLVHFNYDRKYVIFFSFLMWFSFIPCFLEYFRLMCIQIQGLTGCSSEWASNGTLIGLIILIITIRVYHIGEETIALGIVTTTTYFLFLVWAQITAPAGPKRVEPFGQPFQLAASLVSGYSVHDFVAQNFVKNPNRKAYPKLVGYSFIIGAVAYTFFAQGSFAVINRIALKAHPETIYDFFKAGEWQIIIIQAIYFFHFITVFPNFLIISNVQFFNMFKVEIKSSVRWYEYVYIIVTVFVSYLVYVLGIEIVTIVVINGTIVCFTYVIAFPIWMHLKCVFYDRSCGFIEGDDQRNKSVELNRCECEHNYSSKWTLYLQTFFLILTFTFGIAFIVLGLKTLQSPAHH